MTRTWVEAMAALLDICPLPHLIFGLLLVTTLIAVLWFTFPSWVPRRPRYWLGRLRLLLRRRHRAKDEPAKDEATPVPEDEPSVLDVPEVPASEIMSLADRLAAEGRYAEAIRERLRAIVRTMVDARLVEHRPGWTVLEFTTAAVAGLPEAGEPLRRAGEMFSEIWYGARPATRGQDATMRQLAEQVTAGVTGWQADRAHPSALRRWRRP